MLEALMGFIVGVVITVGAPRLKQLLTKIINKGFNKATKEVDRWH